MIDLHAHILPGLDDGPKTTGEAVAMARAAVAAGTSTMVASPHAFDRIYWNDRMGVRAGVAALQAELHQQNIPLQVLPAMENRVDPDLVQHIRQGAVQTVNDSRYILIELPYGQIPLYTEHVLFSLLAEGLVPVLVHPERTRPFQEDPNILGRFVESGVLALLSADSLENSSKRSMRKTVNTFVTHHLVHGVASDAHDSRRRPPGLVGAYRALAKIFKQDRVPEWLEQLPARMIGDEMIDRPEPQMVTPRRGLFWA